MLLIVKLLKLNLKYLMIYVINLIMIKIFCGNEVVNFIEVV